MKFSHYKITLALIASTLVALAALRAEDTNVPAWKNPAPGTTALLGDDGGGVNVATVCDTADRYRDWLKMKSPPGCQTFQHDLPVVIEVMILDAVADAMADIWLPLVKIYIPSRQFTGYVRLLELHPQAPPGTTIHFTRTGNENYQLYEAPALTENKGINLGDKVSATVLRYDPTPDDKWDLHVRINDGLYAGKEGWMLSFGATTDDGNPMDQFSNAVISNKRRW